MKSKSGFISVIGRPNVGKSTLINKIVGEKVNIISAKPQTTRNKINAIYTEERGQIIFIDTPGIHRARNELDKYMLKQAYESLKEIDLIIFMVDGTSPFGGGDRFINEQIKSLDTAVIVVMNKIDKLNSKLLQDRLENYKKNTGREVIPIAAATGKNISNLLDEVFAHLPEGPQYYPSDMFTDQIERFIVAELIREKIFNLTREEIPYGVAVLVEEMKERDKGKLLIRANIYVEKKSHKGMIIGKKGSMLKEIGKRSRRDIEKLLQTEVYLDLWVKIQQDWREDEKLLQRLGYKS